MSEWRIGKGVIFTIIVILLAIGMNVTIIGCNNEPLLVGKWLEIKDGQLSDEFLEFLPNGIVVNEDGDKFEWKAEEKRIIISYDSEPHLVYDYEISGLILIFTDKDGGKKYYKKDKK